MPLISCAETESRPAIFLDRDGTLNEETGYLYKKTEWRWLPGAREAIAMLNRADYLVVVVTNQAGIARGLYRAEDVLELHCWVNTQLAEVEAKIDGFYFCPHHPEFTGVCSCRKPKPGMLLQAAQELGIDLKNSWMVGDKLSDFEAGVAAGCKSILVHTGYGKAESCKSSVLNAPDLYDAARKIISQTIFD